MSNRLLTVLCLIGIALCLVGIALSGYMMCLAWEEMGPTGATGIAIEATWVEA